MVPRIGVGSAIVLIIAGQLLIAAVIDHFGWLGVDNTPITWQRAMGMALVLLGAWLSVRGQH
jgi:transporter family-2 protein